MRDQEFKAALDNCLEWIRQGKSLEECVKAYPQHADRLMPFLTSAATLRGMGVPEPSTSGMQRARNNLLTRVAEGSGKEAAVVRGAFKFANIAAVAVAAIFVAGIGFAAAGPGGLFSGSGGDGASEFNSTVISAAPTLLYVQNNDDGQYVYLVLSNQTQYQDANGNAIARTDVRVRDRVWVRAMPSPIGARFFDARLIRLGGPPSEPTAAPPTTQEVTPAPQPTEAPKPTDIPATPKPTDAPVEKTPTPKPTDKPATPKPTEKPVSEKIEFWGVVQIIAPTTIQMQTEWGSKYVHVNGSTQYPAGHPVVGAKVLVLATKQPDGSFVAHKITVKMIEFVGQVTAVNGGTFTVNADGQNKTVLTNGGTSFPNGVPVVGNVVHVFAYKMGDGSYLAKEMTVKTEVESFTGVIVHHDPGTKTIKVDVGGSVKVVCYESAVVEGTLAVGVTVLVEVDHVEGATYFAGLVKVMS
jgi:hypothetical protein